MRIAGIALLFRILMIPYFRMIMRIKSYFMPEPVLRSTFNLRRG
jgi:hypothetical protein